MPPIISLGRVKIPPAKPDAASPITSGSPKVVLDWSLMGMGQDFNGHNGPEIGLLYHIKPKKLGVGSPWPSPNLGS
jgi:hypothetical protein